jgi:hypothetical protein
MRTEQLIEEFQKLLNELPSFKHFQEQLRSGGLEVPSKQELNEGKTDAFKNAAIDFGVYHAYRGKRRQRSFGLHCW